MMISLSLLSIVTQVLLWIFVTVLVVLAVGALITLLTSRSQYQRQFRKGTLPAQPPQGFYRGTAHVLLDRQTPWLGKSFVSQTATGFNLFTPGGGRLLKICTPLYRRFSLDEAGHTRAYHFKTYTGRGLRDPQEVVKLDYASPENPWLIRIILDEIVEVAPDRFLGKIHVQVVPGLYVTIGYFGLQK